MKHQTNNSREKEERNRFPSKCASKIATIGCQNSNEFQKLKKKSSIKSNKLF